MVVMLLGPVNWRWLRGDEFMVSAQGSGGPCGDTELLVMAVW